MMSSPNRIGAPLISVLMSVYNGEEYLAAAIESVLNQTFRDLEFIIINDGSTDNSGSILSSYASRDPRIRVVTNDLNIGLTLSLCKGLDMARGRYIARQDADDISLPGRFEKQVALLEDDPDCAMVGSAYERMDPGGRYLNVVSVPESPDEIRLTLLRFNLFAHGTMMFRNHHGIRYRPDRQFAQDYQLVVDVLSRFEVRNINVPLYRIRRDNPGISLLKKAEQNASAREILATHVENVLSSQHGEVLLAAHVLLHMSPFATDLSDAVHRKGLVVDRKRARTLFNRMPAGVRPALRAWPAYAPYLGYTFSIRWIIHTILKRLSSRLRRIR
jgi:glycosyltransferase involved in cell wall biosynthesis